MHTTNRQRRTGRGGRWLRLLAPLAIPFTLSACFLLVPAGLVALGAGGMAWYKGVLHAEIDQPITRVHRAAAAALLDLGVRVESNELKRTSSYLDGDMPDGKRVSVKLNEVGAKKTRLRIRVGMWGDQAVSRKLLVQIKKHL